MRFDVITLLPELIAPYLSAGVGRRAYESKKIQVHLWQLRDFASGAYRRVDDRPFGGGPGMVLMAQPLQHCLQAIVADRGAACPVVLFSPVGQTITQSLIEAWAWPEPAAEQARGAVLICGRYEGVDQRFIDHSVTHQMSLGDFVLSGGEIVAAAFLDAIARLQAGVLGDQASHQEDSFNTHIQGMLDCPHFTRPEVWEVEGRQLSVPSVLLGGNHAQIRKWREHERLRLTEAHRPDLLPKL